MQRFLRRTKRRYKGKIEWIEAADIQARVAYLIRTVELDWVKQKPIFCLRSQNANTRAYARIWGLSRVWQIALNIKPGYVLEVISEKFDHLPQREKDKILLHEIAHIPHNFSGALVPHTKKGTNNFHDKLETMIARYFENN